jgi:hypothetical protein
LTDNQRKIAAHLDNLHIQLSHIRAAVTGEAEIVVEAVDRTEIQLLKGMKQIRDLMSIGYGHGMKPAEAGK